MCPPNTIFLTIPLILILSATPLAKTTQTMKTALKVSFILSLLPLITTTHNNTQTTMNTTLALPLHTNNLNFNISLDQQTTAFTTVALLITWSITEFTTWYMNKDPKLHSFTKLLTMFLVAMFTIITANNMYQLTVGWEAVGMMSFLLIGWWHARSNANTAALQAIIYNRIGDIGIILALSWFFTHTSWDFKEMLQQTEILNITPALAILFAAMGKSAQLGFHPWLPMAMEGPTPVSALLHSSTMVVAGVFLLIRLHPITKPSQMTTTLCLMVGATTTLIAAIAATAQNDIKKVIAFSTTSQLGLMMTALGLNKPNVAFLHLIMHAFFKALLFLCAGSLIHNLNNEQDARKMGGLKNTLPFTSTSITTAGLALTGMPFLSGFYSKDAIIENMAHSNPNAWATLTTLAATTFSTAYTTRIIFLTQTNNMRALPKAPHPENPPMINPTARLTVGAIASGLLTKLSSLSETTVKTTPTPIKLMMLLFIIGPALYIAHFTWTSPMSNPKKPKIPTLFNYLMFYNTPHRSAPMKALKYSQNTTTELLDLWMLENLGSKNLMLNNLTVVHLMNKQKKQITTYLMLLTSSALMSMTLTI